jgi:RNA polymerase primary sigma factor
MTTKPTHYSSALDQYMQDLDTCLPMDIAEEQRLTLRIQRLRERLARLLDGIVEPHRLRLLGGSRIRRDMPFAQIETIVFRLAREAQDIHDMNLEAMARQARAILQYLASARATLVTRNLRLVFLFARRAVGRGALLSDIVQIGNLALIQATDRFDPRRGVRFSTYAGMCVQGVIAREMTGLIQKVHVPTYQIQLRTRLNRSRRSLAQELGREPTIGETAAQARLTEEQARGIIASKPTMIDLDAPRPDSKNLRLADTLASDDAKAMQDRLILGDLMDHLQDTVVSLEPRLRTVIRLRYGLDGKPPRTLGEIGDTLHLTRERIRQLEKEAIRVLRIRMRRLSDGGSTARRIPACAVRHATAGEG